MTISQKVPFGEGLYLHEATPEDFDDILKFVHSDFLKTEPLTNSLQATPEDMDGIFRDCIKLALADPCITNIVRTIDTDEVVALRMAAILTRPLEPEPFVSYPSWKANAIGRLLCELQDQAWKILPDAHKLATGVMLSVSSKYQRRGIGQSLIEYGDAKIRALGCEGIIIDATAIKSQKLFSKLGYRSLYEIPHSEYKINGHQVFKCLDGTDRAILCYKHLS